MVYKTWHYFTLIFITTVGLSLIYRDLSIFSGSIWASWTFSQVWRSNRPLVVKQVLWIAAMTVLGLVIGTNYAIFK